MITPWRFRFVKLDSRDEGERVNRKTGKKKADYLGQICRQVTTTAPYGMEFIDGAIWALDASQLELVGEDGSYQSFGPSTDKYRKRVRCIETGEIFGSQAAAARWAGVRSHMVSMACDSGCATAGYHFERLEDAGE